MEPPFWLPEEISNQLCRFRSRDAGRGHRRHLLGLVVSLLGLAAFALLRWRRSKRLGPVPVALSAILRLLREKSVQELTYSDGLSLAVRLKSGSEFSTVLVPGSESSIFKLASQVGVPKIRYAVPNRGMAQVYSWFSLLIFIGLWYAVAKSLITRNEKFEPRKRQRETRVGGVSFKDVVCRSKIELVEIVDYLNDPQKYKQVGAKMPRGTLLVGPSGTGKTLLARAVAGEARCHFICASASEFVEVYVGRGAARVRDLFKQARALAPAVVFIDELDALGSRSGASGRGPNEEYVQTLNQVLTELDGFHGQADGIVVLAATNRREAVDSALLRPGRFDRHVLVDLPDEEERLEILKVHAFKSNMAKSIVHDDRGLLKDIAKDSDGLSGADLANIINEALFLAMRDGRKHLEKKDLRGALQRARAAKNGSTAHSTVPPWAPKFQQAFGGWPMPMPMGSVAAVR